MWSPYQNMAYHKQYILSKQNCPITKLEAAQKFLVVLCED